MISKRKINPYPLYNSDSPLLSDYKDSLNVFLNKPFWIWDQDEHNEQFTKTVGQCCFNHIVGLPIKNDKQYPIFPFQQQIYNTIENNQNIWILKSRGIGITTFVIRYLAWKILSSSELDNKSIFIISGTREEHANYIKQKLQELFERKFPFLRLESKYTELWLKNTWIKVFPTKNAKDIRGYFEASYIWVDESDYLEESIQEELIHAIGPYEEKSNCKIILSSTPFKPQGMMERIEKDSNSKYKKLKLDYTYGLGTIYDAKEIAKKKLDVEWSREYECQYLGKQGDLLTKNLIDKAIQNYELVKDIPNTFHAMHSVGIDPGWGSSACGVVVTEHLKDPDIIRVIYAEEFRQANPDDIVKLYHSFHRKYWPNIRCYVDGANAGFIRQLKISLDDNPDSDYKDDNEQSNEVISVSFGTSHKQLLQNLYMLMNKEILAIPPQNDKLITSLHTAKASEYSLDKEQTSYSDILDGFRLSLKMFKLN